LRPVLCFVYNLFNLLNIGVKVQYDFRKGVNQTKKCEMLREKTSFILEGQPCNGNIIYDYTVTNNYIVEVPDNPKDKNKKRKSRQKRKDYANPSKSISEQETNLRNIGSGEPKNADQCQTYRCKDVIAAYTIS
jgi:hypothetical protein